MFVSRRWILLATSVSTALILSACQPTKDNDDTDPTAATPPVTDIVDASNDVDADNDLAAGENSADESQMTDILRDYTRSMTRMHDEMMIGMGYNDPDTAFAKAMLGHHRGAVEMAKIQLKYGTDEEMRQLAQEIITAQQLEIDILNKWLASHPDTAKPKPNTEAMQQAYARSMDVLNGEMVLGIADPVPDMAFARGMLPHHIGAVAMANIQLNMALTKRCVNWHKISSMVSRLRLSICNNGLQMLMLVPIKILKRYRAQVKRIIISNLSKLLLRC
ncbi:putative exported protein [Psychrobacter sp. JCM 18903]|nr:putative exported protein [Psychrobacter sp. JCM 18903]